MTDNDDDCSEYFDFRNVEEISSESFESQSAISSSISENSLFLESPVNNKQIKRQKSSKTKNPSFVWKYFKKTENENVQCIIPIIKNGKESPCSTSYKFTGSTSNMKYHLNVIHNKTEGSEEKKVNIKKYIYIYL
jgi:hypothetical protein